MPDSTATAGTPVTPAPIGKAADCTSPNGNGHSEVVADSGKITLSFGDSSAVLRYTGNGDFGLTTGYLQSDTASRGVIRITTNQAFTYTGTGSTLVGLTAATNATILRIEAPSATISTGTLTALGVGSTALAIKATGGPGSGGIDVTVDGDVSSAKRGILLEQSHTSTTGAVVLTSTAGNSITAGAGNAVTILTKASGTIAVDLAGDVSATVDGISAVTKGGDISISVGNVTTVSSEAIDARQSNAAGAGAISITANGDVSGEMGIRALNSGTGSVTVAVSGSVTGTGDDAIHITSSNASAGATDVTTTSGAVISARDGDGIDVDQQGSGDVEVINNATINSGAMVNTLLDGIDVNAFGTGNVTIENYGAIGTAGDRAQATAINAAINNIAASGDVSVSGTGDIFAVSEGIDVFISGSGFAVVAYDGDIDTTGGPAIQIDTKGGTITATTGGSINADGHGIDTTSTTGNQLITINSAVSGGTDGVNAVATSGTITVNINGGNVTGDDDAVDVSGSGAKTINVAAGRTLSAGDLGIASLGTGATTINNGGTISSTGVTILSATSATTVNNLAGATVIGGITLSAVDDSVTNAGTIAGALTLAAGADIYDGRNGSIGGTVNGGDGNDTLQGGAGAETMIGGNGADILEGNGGSDILTGGADGDSFRGTAAGLNSDRITDFAAGDTIVITDASLNGFSFSQSGSTLTYTGGSLTLTGFTGQLQASAAAGGGVQLTVVQTAAAAIAAADFIGGGPDDRLWQPIDSASSDRTVAPSWDSLGFGNVNRGGRDAAAWRQEGDAFSLWPRQAKDDFDAGAYSDMAFAPSWQVPPDLIF